jgi:tetratricopeptide (TPR) repeat protein
VSDHDRGWALANHGFDLWQQHGRLEEAAEAYREAVPLLDPTHYWTPLVHGQYASVLAALGRSEEARAQAQRHLDVELRQDPSGRSASVMVARYFVAEHAIHCGDPDAALNALQPCLGLAGKLEGALRVVQADALTHLGRHDEAVGAARLALAATTSDHQRQSIDERLHEILGPNWNAG